MTIRFQGRVTVGELVGEGCKVSILGMSMRRNARPQEYCYVHSMYVNTCQNCNQKFHTGRLHKKTCSDKCRKSLSRSKV